MKFFHFHQSNPGGSYDNSMPTDVVIEASSAFEANVKAEDIGIYFDGVSKEMDCSCCGDRWYRVDDSEGTEVPTFYNEPIKFYGNDIIENVVVYFVDGTTKTAKDGVSKLEKALK